MIKAGSIPEVMSGGRSQEVTPRGNQEKDKIRKRGMESVPQNTILKTNVIRRKLEDTGTFMGSKDNKTGVVFVR